MRPLDTTAADHQRQVEIYRGMTPEERVAHILELTEFARSVTCAGISTEHPEWTADQIQRELVRRILGRDHQALAGLPTP